MKLAVIVAQARNRVIGIDNRLPWHLPADLKYFKEVTSGKPVIMGRKTFESIGRPLPNRHNIVVTRDSGWHHEGVRTASSLPEAVEMARAYAEEANVDEVMVIGGAQIYAQALPLADMLYVTEVQLEPEGDAVFPELLASEWAEIEPPIYRGRTSKTVTHSVF
ncbi:dihydrofolate reductase [Marinobacterium aestuariivivens]|uniref:Dihydrofolate reductase n=1 Tax=Marinobacterium aestuariivivens TaxID=1698799 RepID=A0ABW2A089_9GAMM